MKDKKLNKRKKIVAKHQGYFPELEAVVVEKARVGRAQRLAIGITASKKLQKFIFKF
jgi:hypothetical protein